MPSKEPRRGSGAVVQDLLRAAGHAGPRPDQRARPGPRVRLPQFHPGRAPVHDHQHPGGAGRHLDRELPFPPQNPPTAALIEEWVPVSVSATTFARGNPPGCPLESDGPPNAARFAGVSGTSSTNPSTAARPASETPLQLPAPDDACRRYGLKGPPTLHPSPEPEISVPGSK